MIIVNNFYDALKRSEIEIFSDDLPYKLLCDYLIPYHKEKLPDSVTFKVSAGKKNYDVIRLFESGECFFSQKFINVLSQFMDMSDKCYPIKVEGLEEQYYVIYNLDHYPFINKNRSMFNDEPSFYSGKKITTPLFGITDTRCHVVTKEIKNALIKNKISNIEFEESFLCTKEEYKEWRKSHHETRTRSLFHNK